MQTTWFFVNVMRINASYDLFDMSRNEVLQNIRINFITKLPIQLYLLYNLKLPPPVVYL